MNERTGKNLIRLLVLLAAGSFFALGWADGGLRINWMKACVICLECIGLG